MCHAAKLRLPCQTAFSFLECCLLKRGLVVHFEQEQGIHQLCLAECFSSYNLMQYSEIMCRCIMCLIFLVTAAIIAAIVMKITGVGDKKVKLPGRDDVRLQQR
jgi:hypothetical protein